MAFDDLLEITAKVSIKRHGRTVRLGQGDRFRKQAAGEQIGGAEHCNGPTVILNDYFCSRAGMGKQRRHIGVSRFLLRNVNHTLWHALIIPRQPLLLSRRHPFGGRVKGIPMPQAWLFQRSEVTARGRSHAGASDTHLHQTHGRPPPLAGPVAFGPPAVR